MLIQLFKFSTYNSILVHFESNVSFIFGKCISACTVNKCNYGSEACKKKLLEPGQDYHRGHDIMGPQNFNFCLHFCSQSVKNV